MNEMLTTRIEKETIPNFSFPKEDVLYTETDRKERLRKLKRGLQLGNGFKNKATIEFETLEGRHDVRTTLWAVTKSHVLFKGGVNIPIHAILNVKL